MPVVQTSYITQGMRDTQAVLKLKLLETKPTEIVQERVLELIELTSMFSQTYVSSYIEQNKDKHPRVKNLLLIAQE